MKEKTHKNPHYKTFTTYRASKKYKKKKTILKMKKIKQQQKQKNKKKNRNVTLGLLMPFEKNSSCFQHT